MWAVKPKKKKAAPKWAEEGEEAAGEKHCVSDSEWAEHKGGSPKVEK